MACRFAVYSEGELIAEFTTNDDAIEYAQSLVRNGCCNVRVEDNDTGLVEFEA